MSSLAKIPVSELVAAVTPEQQEKIKKASDNLNEWNELFKKYPHNTRRAYMSDIADYQVFCQRKGLPWLSTDFDTSKEVYKAYIDELIASELKRATIERRISTLSVLYGVVELPNPIKTSKMLSEYVRLSLRDKPKAQKQAEPMRIDDLEAINRDFAINSLKDLRDLMVLNFAFAALLRGSELAEVEHKHISVRDNTLFIPKRKNDQDGQGGYSYLSDECLELYERWRKESGQRSGKLFRAIRKGDNVTDSSLEYRGIYNIFKSVYLRCGLDPSNISTHSGRVGSAVSMAEAGISGFEIQMSGGWSDSKMVARYSQQANMRNAGIAKLMKGRK